MPMVVLKEICLVITIVCGVLVSTGAAASEQKTNDSESGGQVSTMPPPQGNDSKSNDELPTVENVGEEKKDASEIDGSVISELTIKVMGKKDELIPVSGAHVYIKYDHTRYEDITDSNGVVSVSGIPPGELRVTITAPGWETFGKKYDFIGKAGKVEAVLSVQHLKDDTDSTENQQENNVDDE